MVIISVWFELLVLDAEVACTRGEALKDSTKKNLLTYLSAYQKFCDHYMLPYFPVDNNQICRFGQHLARTFQSPDAVGNYQSAIQTFSALLGLPIPNPLEKEMQMFSQGLKRIMEHEVKQAAPITPEILLRMSRVVDYTCQIDMVAWVGTLIGFTMFLRKSNLVPDTMTTFNPQMQFTRQDFHLTGTPLSHDGKNNLGQKPPIQAEGATYTSATSRQQSHMPSNVATLHDTAGTSGTTGSGPHNMDKRGKTSTISKPVDIQDQEMAQTYQGE